MKGYLGIDVSAEQLDVAVWLAGKRQYIGQYANDATGYAQLRQAAEQWPAETWHVVSEASGGYEAGLVATAHACGWQVSVENPYRVRRWADGQGRRAKTDRQDALVLAEYGGQQQPSPQEMPSEAAQELEQLENRRLDVAQQLRAERNRQAQLGRRPRLPQAVAESLERTIAHLEEELAALEEAMAAHIRSTQELAESSRLLQTIPGVGPRTVVPLLVVLHRFAAYTHQQGTAKGLTAYLGLDPRPHMSGSSVQRRSTISKMGNRQTRSALYMGALGGIRGQNRLRDFYRTLCDRGKAGKLALVACARKILVWAWAVFQQQTPFQQNLAPIPT